MAGSNITTAQIRIVDEDRQLCRRRPRPGATILLVWAKPAKITLSSNSPSTGRSDIRRGVTASVRWRASTWPDSPAPSAPTANCANSSSAAAPGRGLRIVPLPSRAPDRNAARGRANRATHERPRTVRRTDSGPRVAQPRAKGSVPAKLRAARFSTTIGSTPTAS